MHADTTSRTELEIGAKLGAIIQNATARERLVANPAEVLAEVAKSRNARKGRPPSLCTQWLQCMLKFAKQAQSTPKR